MNTYEEYEKELKSHIVFAYNHLNMGEKSFLGYEFVNKMEDIFSELHEYDHMILTQKVVIWRLPRNWFNY